MTKEEAIKEFESELKWAELNTYPYVSKKKIEADKMAIKALEQGSCEDCIDREEAKQFLYERLDRLNDDELYDIFSKVIDYMYNELPPVTPKPKTGRWIKTISENGITSAVRCSECGFEDNRYMLFRYCPNCGARMTESEDKE